MEQLSKFLELGFKNCLPNVYPKTKKPSQIIDLQGFMLD